MNHLTDEQLAAQIDGPRSGPTFDAAARHLESCEACRARLADMTALDADLSRALEHDPGEAYFASFADRVASRIAAEAAPARAAAPVREPRRGLFAWWNSPRQLAWAGGALGLVVVAALAVVLVRQNGMRATLDRLSAPETSAMRAPAASGPAAESAPQAANEIAPPAAAPAEPGAASGASAPSTAREEEARDAAGARRDRGAFVPAPVAPSRVMQMRPGPNGEAVPVAPQGLPVLDRAARTQKTPGGFVKPGASSAGAASQEAALREERAAGAMAPAERKQVETLDASSADRIAPSLAENAPAPAATPTFATKPAPTSAPAAAPPAVAKPAPATPPAVATPAPASERAKSVLQGFAKALGGTSPPATTTPSTARALGDTRTDAAAPKLASPAPATAQAAPETTPTRRLCGVVTDAKRRPVAGAIVSITDSGRSTTADADGRFCLELEAVAKTLEIDAVGYRSERKTVLSTDQQVAVTLTPVDVIGGVHLRGGTPLETRQTIRSEPASFAEAREASALASREKSEDLWRRAARLWSAAAGERSLAPEPKRDARWHVAEAWMNAWRLGHWPSESLAARDAIEAYLADAPEGPMRDIVLGWKKELGR